MNILWLLLKREREKEGTFCNYLKISTYNFMAHSKLRGWDGW